MIVCMVKFTLQPEPDYDAVAEYLRSQGHEVWVTDLYRDGNFVWDNGKGRQIVQEGPQPIPTNWPNSRITRTVWAHLSTLAFVRQVRNTIGELQPDVVQVNSSGLKHIDKIPLAMPKTTTFILDFRQIGDRRLPTTFGRRIRNKTRSITRRFKAVYIFDHSCYLHRAGAEKGLGEHWERWGTVVPMGVNDLFLESTRTVNGGSGDSRIVRFIYIGTIAKIRRLETLLSAVRIVADTASNFEFHFLGGDISDGYYTELVKRLQIEQHVCFLPLIPYNEVPQRLVEYDAAIAFVPYEPTDWMYHPTIKVLEYKAIGVPIVATDVPPNREFVESGYNGFLCDNTAEDFAHGMLQLINDRQLLKQTRDNAEHSRGGLNWVDVAQKYETLYARLVRQRNQHASKN